MLDKKSQAALEFLMSYGWAILVVLIAVGALSYFGVLNLSMFLPEKCTLVPGIACLDFRAGTDGVTLVIKNSIGDSIVVESVTVTAVNNCETTFFTKLNNGEQGTFNVGCNLTGSKLNSELRFIYEGVNALQHNASGRLISRIEQNTIGIGTGQTDLQVCQDWQNNGLCEALDLFYGEGYRAACCSEYSLCCA